MTAAPEFALRYSDDPGFRVLAADPPWMPEDELPGETRGAAKNYACLPVEAIERFPIPPMAEDSILFLWRLASMQEEALRVSRAWGYVVKSELIWEKLTPKGRPWFGMGRFVRASHETCLIATRGRASALVLDHGIRSRFSAKVGRHSAKPDAFYAIAERLCAGPRAEIFARTRRPGWSQWGLELESGAPAPERTDAA